MYKTHGNKKPNQTTMNTNVLFDLCRLMGVNIAAPSLPQQQPIELTPAELEIDKQIDALIADMGPLTEEDLLELPPRMRALYNKMHGKIETNLTVNDNERIGLLIQEYNRSKAIELEKQQKQQQLYLLQQQMIQTASACQQRKNEVIQNVRPEYDRRPKNEKNYRNNNNNNNNNSGRRGYNINNDKSRYSVTKTRK